MYFVTAGGLKIAYQDVGPKAGEPLVLLHGFPYDIYAFEEVVPILANRGFRCIVPYLRGFGATQYLSEQTPRSGQQAALASDLLNLLAALEIPKAYVAGYDWGGRAACIAAALWPDRVKGLLSCGVAYNIQNIPAAHRPISPQEERSLWYQYYFHNERGRAGLAENREELIHLLWREWSPTWNFSNKAFQRTLQSFENPDFVPTVIHSYRHRYGLAAGDPAVEAVEEQLIALPSISVPTHVLLGEVDSVCPPIQSQSHKRHFTGYYRASIVPSIGHNLPQEAPEVFAQSLVNLADYADRQT